MTYDYIIVGSGAAGASAAKYLTDAGLRVLVLEEGGWFGRGQFKTDVFTAIQSAFRGFGSQLARGRSLVPILQGCCVGGSTVINGAISHPLPDGVYDEWLRFWGKDLKPSATLERIRHFEAKIAEDLKIGPTLSNVETLPIAEAFRALDWKFAAMARNAPGCQGSGNCLQGCQTGAKLSMEASFLPRSVEKGAEIQSRHRVLRVASGKVWAKNLESGEKKEFTAKRGIILAAGVVHTPVLLQKSGIRHPFTGRNFQCHISFGVLGRLPRKAREMEGQPQGIEVFPPESEGIKLATQLLPPELLFSRVPLVGDEMTKSLRDWSYFSSWTASVRSGSSGSVHAGFFGGPRIRYTPSVDDMKQVRSALAKIAALFFEMGASEVYPGVHGLPEKLTSIAGLEKAPIDPRAYFLGAAHLFGTCRMGPNAGLCPVDEHFEVRGAKNVFVLDASIFPTNIGVNPQLPIMALAMAGAQHIAERA